jgi:hypothetical protein
MIVGLEPRQVVCDLCKLAGPTGINDRWVKAAAEAAGWSTWYVPILGVTVTVHACPNQTATQVRLYFAHVLGEAIARGPINTSTVTVLDELAPEPEPDPSC